VRAKTRQDQHGDAKERECDDGNRRNRIDQHQPPFPLHAARPPSDSCRGTRLFPGAHHDAAAIQKIDGPIPLAGFFAQGELGPIGNRNYLHGFTASIALFE
jgi:small ligand-binding sensory domain FIST